MDALAKHATQVETDGPFFSGAESGHAWWARGVLPARQGHRRPRGRRRLRGRTSSPGCDGSSLAARGLRPSSERSPGAAGTLLHQHWWGLALGARPPGLASLAWLPPGWRTRSPSRSAGAVPVGCAAALERPGGGFLIAADASGWSFLAGSLVLLVAALATRPRPARGAPRIRDSASADLNSRAWRRTPRALTGSPATRPARPSSCWLLLGLVAALRRAVRRRALHRRRQGRRAARPSPASASAATRRPRPRSGSRPGSPTGSPATIADHHRAASRSRSTRAEAGLGVDYDASVAEAGGEESWDPVRLWDYFTGGDTFEAEVTVDDADLPGLRRRPRRAARRRAPATARWPSTAPDRHDEGPHRRGARPRRDPRGRCVRPSWPTSPPTWRSSCPTCVPTSTRATSQEALDGFAYPAVSAPVTLRFDGSDVKVSPADYTAALSLVPTDGELVPTLDAAALTEVVGGPGHAAARRSTPPSRSSAATPQVVPAKPGVTFDPAELEAGFLGAGRQAPGRAHPRARPPRSPKPAFTTKDARALAGHRAGLDLHDLLPLRRVPQHQHRPGRRARRRHPAQARRDLLPQRHRRGAHRGQRLHQGLRHQRRHPHPGPRRRRLADGDDDLQRDVLRRPRGRRAQAALVLHRPLPGRSRGDGRLGRGRPAVPATTPRTAC